MGITSDQYLLIGGIVVVAVILLGVGVYGSWRSRKAQQATPDSSAADKPAAPASDKSTSDWMRNLADTASRTVTRTAAPTLPLDAIVVWRDPAGNEWLVEINGMQYRSLKDIHDDRAAGKILEALSGLQRFAGSLPLVKPGAEKATAAGATTATTVQTTEVPTQPVHPAPPDSILDQIEKVLQRNLAAYPELAPRRIHVGMAADGSLLIELDRQEYYHVEEVPDEQVRALIQEAIREWERTA